MKRMLFNATQQEELRVAIVDGQKLIDIDIETTGREQHKSNIYKAVITRIEPSLEACFVNYGEDRHGFLPFKEVSRSLFREGVDVRSASIKNALREGQEVMVQVEKEERGNKGAALTTFVSLAGRYLVLMPNNPRGGGVSRRVEGEERQELRETMDKLDVPPGMSVIARTAGIGRNVEELQWDLNYLLQLWRAIESAGTSAPGAFLIYHESSLVIRAIRDYFQPDIGEILVDTDEIYEQATQFMSHVMPDMMHRVKRYRDDVPLFSRFQIEHQIETAYSRNVPLPSGGSIVIDHTEALVSIDVNSARSTRGADIETTAFNTNCEAAEEVARQMRLRDLGGLIVIDFIDMESAKNQREIENRLKESLRHDRARVQMGKISRFGLMELSRQRLRPSLSEGSHVACPRCNGTGHIRDIESSALQVLRIIEEESMKENSAAIHVQMPVDVAAFLLNEKRGEIFKIETRHQVSVILIPNKHLETPHYKLERIKHDDARLEQGQVSYSLAEQPDTDAGYSKRQNESVKPRQEAMVKSIPTGAPAPVVDRTPAPVPQPAPVSALEKQEEGFFAKLLAFFRSEPAPQPAPVEPPKEARPPKTERAGRGPRSRNRRGGRNRDDGVKPLKLDALESPAATETAPARQQRPQAEPKPERQRGERRTAPQPEKAEETVMKDKAAAAAEIAAGTAGVAAIASQIPEAPAPQPEIQAEEPVEESAAEKAAEERDATRRRRRRGGRNRNRRDRDRVPGQAEEDAGAEVETGNADEIVSSEAESSPAIQESAPQAAPAPAPSPTPSFAREDAEAAPFCWTAPTLNQPVEEQPAVEAAHDAEKPVEQAEPEPAAIIGQLSLLEQPVPTAQPIGQAVDVSEPAAEATDRIEEVQSVEEVVSMEAPAANRPVAEEVPQEAIAEPVEAETKQETVQAQQDEAQTAVAPPTAAATETDLAALLASAGLTMAATDPEKLRTAQTRVEEVASPKPAPRERRRPPAPQEEPLVQVDTRRE